MGRSGNDSQKQKRILATYPIAAPRLTESMSEKGGAWAIMTPYPAHSYCAQKFPANVADPAIVGANLNPISFIFEQLNLHIVVDLHEKK